MDETIILATFREVFKILGKEDFPNRKILLILIIMFIVLIVHPLLQWELNRPDCLSSQERKAEVAADLLPVCQVGYCEEALFREYANSVIRGAMRCDQPALHPVQPKLDGMYEPADDSLTKRSWRTIDQRQLWT